MTATLKFFLLLRTGHGPWSSTSSDTLDGLRDVWTKAVDRNPRIGGVVHAGFDHPEPELFETVGKLNDGRVFVTDAALHLVAGSFRIGRTVRGHVAGFAVHQLMTWWTYRTNDDVDWVAPREAAPQPTGWIADFCAKYPEDHAALRAIGLLSPDTFEAQEARLPLYLRRRLGLHLVHRLSPGKRYNPCAIAATSPGWFACRPLSDIPMAESLRAILADEEIKTVRDIGDGNIEQLMSFDDFSRKSLLDLHDALMASLDKGPIADAPEGGDAVAETASVMSADADDKPTITPGSLLGHLASALNTFDERDRMIIGLAR